MTYGVIYADPPWSFTTYSHKGMGRSASAWYDCMSLDEIRALPVGEWAAPDCVLLLWTTDPFLEHAFGVIRSWGFTFKTVGFYWAKCLGNPIENIAETIRNKSTWNAYATDLAEDAWQAIKWPIGTGYWTRANPEQCLLATRGHPKRVNADVRKLIIAPRREHSRKPDEAYDRIERLCAGPYLELFARTRRPGWDSVGNEVDSGPLRARRWGSTR